MEPAANKDKPKDVTVPAANLTPPQPAPATTVNTIKAQNSAATTAPAPAQKPQPSPAPKAAVQPPPAQKSITSETPEKPRPQKSLAELKASATQVKPAPAEKPTAAVPSPAAKPADPELNIADLDDTGRNLKQAFDEKRVIQLFQPVISLMNEDENSEDEIHRVSMQLIEKDGTIKPAAEIKSLIVLPAFRKFVDRWLLREIIGRLANSSNNKHTFIVDISDASLSDANFFNWLRKLLTGLDSKSPGKHIIMEIDVKHLNTLEKQANALITFLRKSHEFKFMLGNIDTITEIIQFSSKIKFDFVRCNIKLINELAAMVATDKTKSNSQLELIKSDGSRFIADDIVNATALTEGITAGAEYAMGEFIGEPAAQLDDVTNFETFEII